MEKIPPIGERLSPILHEISETLWEHEANLATKPDYNMQGFQAACHIFTSAMLDFAYNLYAISGKDKEFMSGMATNMGRDIRNMILTYTGLDSAKFYRDETDKRNN